jgi:hypothetical protein
MRHLDAHRKNEPMAMARRWLWPSRYVVRNLLMSDLLIFTVVYREHAVRDLTTSPYYRVWDPEAREAFIKYALTTLPSGAVRTKSHPELVSFLVPLYQRTD